MVARWTRAEKDALRQGMAAGQQMAALTADLGRSEDTVRVKLRAMGLRRDGGSAGREGRTLAARWTRAEKDALRQGMAAGRRVAALAADLGRSERAVLVKLRAMGLRRDGGSAGWEGRAMVARWTLAEKDALRQGMAAGRQVAALAADLGRSERAVLVKLRSMGLRRDGGSAGREGRTLAARWTRAEKDALRRGMAAGQRVAALAADLGRSEDAVRAKLRAMAAGRQVAALAADLGRSEDSVRAKMRVMRLRRPGLRPGAKAVRLPGLAEAAVRTHAGCQAIEGEPGDEACKRGAAALPDRSESPARAHAGCQWIEGEPIGGDACKCGAPALPGRPYCAAHHARAYLPNPEAA